MNEYIVFADLGSPGSIPGLSQMTGQLWDIFICVIMAYCVIYPMYLPHTLLGVYL